MTSLDFGPLVLGGNVFGWTADERESARVLDAFVDAGGVAIDTADAYSHWVEGNEGGESEEIIGSWLRTRGRRDDVLIATKIGMLPTRAGLSTANIRTGVEESLRRLGTDYIDLFYAHLDDETVPQEEYLGVFDELVREGKVRTLGASNFTPERLRSAVEIARANDLTPFTVSQDPYNLVQRGIEGALLPAISELGLVELPYSSLASGFLTGKYRPGTTVESVRAEGAAARLADPRAVTLLELLDDIAAQQGTGVAAIALAWLRAQPTVAAPIASARTVEQLPALIESFRVELSPGQLDALDRTSAPLSA